MYDVLILNARKTQEKYKYLPKNVHFIVHYPPQRHKNHAANLLTANTQRIKSIQDANVTLFG